MGHIRNQLCKSSRRIKINKNLIRDFNPIFDKYQPKRAFTLKAFFIPLKLIDFQIKSGAIEFSILKSDFLSLFCNYLTETYYANSNSTF
ncbi:hypothetical protein SAMN06265377_2367 [Flagellimonas pacifica]|uniref:Uncharacterized protein n=1 Tax=Flagellimonas pacifica TaxID=1247520 RepID=A0A285MV19_9FLAO|nr:hypothetical protein SAMN06265377_2367 [Allomuricauda parva]